MRATKNRCQSLAIVLGALGVGCVCSQAVRAQTTSWSIGYTGSITTWTVPYTGQYDITAYGAQGGGGQGGYDPTTGTEWAAGAIIGGRFQLISGQVLSLLVGGSGGWSFPSYINQPGHFSMSGGGGGGTFVVNSATSPLVVAGGGGGIGTLLTVTPGGPGGNNDLANASTSTSGYNAPGVYIDLEGGYGGTNGGGGGIGNNSKDIGGGGGGGFYGDGGTHYKTGAINHGEVQSYGGSSYVNGGAGGSGGLQDYGNFGGFGGGGQGGYERAGGGGGYSGGGGGGGVVTYTGSGTSPLNTGNGGGGGSFLAAEATNSTMSVGNTGNGLVTIARIILNLLVGEDASNQVVSITGGTSTYPQRRRGRQRGQ